MFNDDRRIHDHPLIGRTVTYRPDLPDMSGDPLTDTATVVRPGDSVRILSAFHDWNGVAGLTMFYVHVPATGYMTHLSYRDIGEDD